MAILTGGEKSQIGTEMGGVTDASAVFSRVEPLITPEQLKARFLFGVPLYSMLPDPVTKKRQEYTADLLKDQIARAVNKIELSTNIAITPVQKRKRLPFDRLEYASLGFFRLPDRPITKILSLAVKPAADLGAVYVINPAWLDVGQLAMGQINIIPFAPAMATGGFMPMQAIPTTGGSAFLSVLGHLGWVASFWEIEYWAGFLDGQVPVVVNELIGVTAAISVLSEIGATNRIGNYSVGIDAASQTVDTGGPNVYAGRIEQLDKERIAISNRLRKKLGALFFCNNV